MDYSLGSNINFFKLIILYYLRFFFNIVSKVSMMQFDDYVKLLSTNDNE